MNSPLKPLPDRFTVGVWQVTQSLDQVVGQDQTHKLEPRTMRLLAVLAQAGGDVVLTDDLLNAVWPNLIVTPSSLYDAIAQLRKVLGAEHIATVARKGYRLVTPAPSMTAVASVPEAAPRLGSRSVAVLPFVMRGLPESLSFLSESLAAGLITELSRQPGLTVVALGTMLTFGQRHPPPKQIAEELGVRYIVDGQLVLQGESLHVDVQVVDGQRGTQTSADELVLPVSAWHETATVVVGRLARALRFELNDLASQAPVMTSDAQMQARALAAQAWVQLFARTQTPETNQRATQLARTAIALAPELSQAWMCLAYADWRAGQYRWSDEKRDDQLARALAEAERAVAIDARDPDAYYVLGTIARNYKGQFGRSEEALQHCLRLSSSYAPAHGGLGHFSLRNSRIDDARAHCHKAFTISPLEPLRVVWHHVLAEANLATGNAQGALEEAQKGMAVNPAHAQLYVIGVAAAWQLGMIQLAQDWLVILRQHPAYCSLEAIRVSMAHIYAPVAIVQFENLMNLLREAGLPEQ